MLRRQREATLQISQGQFGCLPRQAMHQVEVEIVETGGSGLLHRGHSILSAMNTPQCLELLQMEALHPQGEPIDTGLSVTEKTATLKRTRVGFQSDLDVIGQRQALRQFIDETRVELLRHQARGTTTEEDTHQRATRRQR